MVFFLSSSFADADIIGVSRWRGLYGRPTRRLAGRWNREERFQIQRADHGPFTEAQRADDARALVTCVHVYTVATSRLRPVINTGDGVPETVIIVLKSQWCRPLHSGQRPELVTRPYGHGDILVQKFHSVQEVRGELRPTVSLGFAECLGSGRSQCVFCLLVLLGIFLFFSFLPPRAPSPNLSN